MNKKVLKATFVAAIAMVSGVNVFNAQKSEFLSDIVLVNVEALADDEAEQTGTLYGNLAGTRYCCAPGSTTSCGAARC